MSSCWFKDVLGYNLCRLCFRFLLFLNNNRTNISLVFIRWVNKESRCFYDKGCFQNQVKISMTWVSEAWDDLLRQRNRNGGYTLYIIQAQGCCSLCKFVLWSWMKELLQTGWSWRGKPGNQIDSVPIQCLDSCPQQHYHEGSTPSEAAPNIVSVHHGYSLWSWLCFLDLWISIS